MGIPRPQSSSSSSSVAVVAAVVAVVAAVVVAVAAVVVAVVVLATASRPPGRGAAARLRRWGGPPARPGGGPRRAPAARRKGLAGDTRAGGAFRISPANAKALPVEHRGDAGEGVRLPCAACRLRTGAAGNGHALTRISFHYEMHRKLS